MDQAIRDKYVTVEDVARDLRCERRAVTRLIRLGKLPAVKLGRSYWIKPEDVQAMLDNATHAA